MKKIAFFLLTLLTFLNADSSLKLVRLRYDGGGDWYNDPEALINLAREIKKRTNIRIDLTTDVVDFKSNAIMNYPFVFITGHGGITFNPSEVARVREYVKRGGFIYVDDDYGMDKSLRELLKIIFPNDELQEIPASHPIFNCFYKFPNGLPKIHKHDDKKPQAFGIFQKKRLVLFYTLESNISDGWADPQTHNDPPDIRETAFRMGINIIYYMLTE